MDEALHAPDTDWLIRSHDEAFDIEITGGWVRLFSLYYFLYYC